LGRQYRTAYLCQVVLRWTVKLHDRETRVLFDREMKSWAEGVVVSELGAVALGLHYMDIGQLEISTNFNVKINPYLPFPRHSIQFAIDVLFTGN
jgi:hypothetical protein